MSALEDTGERYALALVNVVGALGDDGRPRLGQGASCDPGTGGGQCPRVMVQGRQRRLPGGPKWEGGDATFDQELAALAAAPPATTRKQVVSYPGRPGYQAPPMERAVDIDEFLPARGVWVWSGGGSR